MSSCDDAPPETGRRSGEAGSATVWALAWMGLAGVVGWIGVLIAVVVAAQHHLDGSADLASLAGASALQSGRDACAAARKTATDNGVELRTCSVRSSDVLVTVKDGVSLPFGASGSLESAARAGPAAVS